MIDKRLTRPEPPPMIVSMTKNATEMTLTDALAAMVAYLDAETPSTKAEAKKLAKLMAPALEELTSWAQELSEAIDELTNAVEQVADADAGDREDEHATATENAESALIILERTGWSRPEA